MLTIEIRDSRKDPNSEGWLILNGKLIRNSSIEHERYDARVSVSVGDTDAALLLSRCSLAELAVHFSYLELVLPSRVPEFSLTVDINVYNLSHAGIPPITITYTLDIENWAGPWTLLDYAQAIEDALLQCEEADLKLKHRYHARLSQFQLAGTIESTTQPMNPYIDRWVETTSNLIRRAQSSLANEIDPDTLVTLFDFPQHVSTACEQYLLYFVQFLRDLGIEAGASIKHEAHQVLFSVTPNEGAEALDRIREALDIYLRLPDSPEFEAQAPAYGDIAVQQLQANVYHLKGQMMVASAVLQAKNAQIEALQLSNFTYQQLLATQRQAATLPLLPPGTSGADVEPLVPGVIEVTKYEGKGFTVNLPELLRRLKRSFNQE